MAITFLANSVGKKV